VFCPYTLGYDNTIQSPLPEQDEHSAYLVPIAPQLNKSRRQASFSPLVFTSPPFHLKLKDDVLNPMSGLLPPRDARVSL